jgi:glycosyltransferase involved in cell wall biosynthesis
MTLRILTVADIAPNPDLGAAGTEVRTVEALRALGHEVDSVWQAELGRRIQHGNLHLLLELPYTFRHAVRSALRRKRYDVVHVNQPHGYLAARAVHRESPGTVFIHRSHGFEPNVEHTLRQWTHVYGVDTRSRTRKLLTTLLGSLLSRHSREIARVADGHIVSASSDAAFLESRYGVDHEKIAVIPQAATGSFVDVPALPLTSTRLRRILHVAQFAFMKAPMITASVMNELVARANVELVWVSDRAHHSEIRSLLSADANARLTLHSWMPQEELRHIYDSCGIFLFPSFFEGFGKAFLEAMSRGLCVIASDAGGMRDIIEQGQTGFVVPAGDAHQMLAVTLHLLESPREAEAIAAAAGAQAQTFTWERVARRTAEFYEQRLGAPR